MNATRARLLLLEALQRAANQKARGEDGRFRQTEYRELVRGLECHEIEIVFKVDA